MKVFKHYFTEAEERQLFRTIKRVDSLEAKRDLFWMKLMRQTGVRLGVLAGPDSRKAEKLGIDRIGLRVIDAQRSLDTGYLEYRRETNKGSKHYPVFLNQEAINCLKGLLKVHRQMLGNRCPDLPRTDMALILSRTRRPLSRRAYEQRISEWCKQAEVSVGTPHWLRHTWAKRFLAQSTNPAALRHAQAVLGHRNIQTTSIYTEPDLEDLQEAMRVAQ